MGNIFQNTLRKYSNSSSGTSTLKNPAPWFINAIGGGSSSGVKVDERTALTISAYFDGINLLSNHIAYLPFNVIQRDYETGNIEKITDHQLREILHFESNPNMTAFSFKKIMTQWMLNRGNAFAIIEKDGFKITSLTPVKPWETKILKNKESGEIFYRFKNYDRYYYPHEVLHLYQFSMDGIVGMSILEAGARDRFAGHLATEIYGEKFFANGTHMGGILINEDEFPADVTPNIIDKANSKVREELEAVYNGAENFHKIGILTGKYKYQNLTLNANDAQLIERSKMTVEDVARWLHIPVSKLKGGNDQSYNTREHDSLNYVQDGLLPRVQIWQQETRRKLLTDKEKKQGYETQINVKDLLRGDLKSLGEFLSKMVDRGIYSQNMALEFLGEDTFEGGNFHQIQKNMDILERRLEEDPDSEDSDIANLKQSLKNILSENTE